ncbi:MAG: ATP-binding protein, partial [Desulfonatronovibrionaceae bacterium]
ESGSDLLDEHENPLSPQEHPAHRALVTAEAKEGILGIPEADKTTWVLVNAEPILENGQVKNVVVGLTDITRRVNMAKALRHTRISMQDIIDHTPLGVCVTDRHGYFESVNNAYCRLYGYQQSELLGAHFTIVVPAKDKSRLAELHDRFIARGAEIRGQWEVVDREGRPRNILADAARIHSEEGEPKKVTFVMDVTREMEFRRELEKKNRKLEELNASKDRFLGMAAHDLRSPLGGIKSFSDMLLEGMAGELNQEQREYMQLISTSSAGLLNLVNDLLDINAIARGRLELNIKPADLKGLISQSIHKQNLLARKKGISVTGDLEDIPKARLDPERINQVLDNLLSNAIKFSPQGSTVRVFLAADGGDVLIRVADNGPGIPAEEQKSLFSEFHRGRVAPTGNESSTGLGLAIVKRIVEVHGGSIHIESSPGTGAEFIVRLPGALKTG